VDGETGPAQGTARPAAKPRSGDAAPAASRKPAVESAPTQRQAPAQQGQEPSLLSRIGRGLRKLVTRAPNTRH
ncbi:hypothetical protein H0E84_02550, partial [Luteimonas sp. SJ-92]|nr:hypothetical protein [Luteimonas salinisoli]